MSAHLKPVPPVSLVDDTAQPADAIVTARRWTMPLVRPVRISRGWATGLGALALVAAVAVVVSQFIGGKPAVVQATPVQTITVGTIAQAPLARALVVNGSLAAWDELPVGTEAG